jgi:hypothetical protein
VTPGPPTATDRAESTSHQLVIGVRVDSDGDVKAFLHEIDVPVFRDDFEADFRGDLGESGCDPAHRDMAEHQNRPLRPILGEAFEIGGGGHVANSNPGNGILQPETFERTHRQ